jgi:hypothetical protein
MASLHKQACCVHFRFLCGSIHNISFNYLCKVNCISLVNIYIEIDDVICKIVYENKIYIYIYSNSVPASF